MDIRDLYDSVICISTLEHIGLDNMHYNDISSERDLSKTDNAFTNIIESPKVGVRCCTHEYYPHIRQSS